MIYALWFRSKLSHLPLNMDRESQEYAFKWSYNFLTTNVFTALNEKDF
jgi:hypothetical protein